MPGSIPRPENVEVTNTGTVYHKQEDGSKVIAPTRRPDGTYRKPIRVREGYTPLEENVYRGPEVQQRFNARQGPPGYVPDPQPKSKGGPPQRVPGANPNPAGDGGKKSKAADAPARPTNGLAVPPVPTSEPKESAPASFAGSDAGKTAPEKRLRNLRKRLTEITALEERVKKEGAGVLTAELKEKMGRKAEYLAEVSKIERQLAGEIIEDEEPPAPAAPAAQPEAQPSAAPVSPEDMSDDELLKACNGKPENRARNLRKKLAEIAALEAKVKSDGIASLSAELKEKLGRKGAMESEVAALERLMAKLHA